jgi:ABC-type polysaccharide/polyol phosphate export permease
VAELTLAPVKRPRRRRLIRTDFANIKRYRSLVWYQFTSGLATENTGTFFGFLWWLLDPLLLMCVYWFLFGVVFHRLEPYFPIYILISLVSWEFFMKSVERSMTTTLGLARSMRQVKFPKSVVPISTSLTEFVHFAFGLLVSIVLAAVIYGVYPTGRLAGLLALMLVQAAFTLGMAFALTTANFFFRDVSHAMRYVFRAWYLLSPGIYALSRIPEQWRNLYQLNPFAPFFETYHAILLGQPFPPTWALVYVTALSFGLLVFGYVVYLRAEPSFVKLSD